MSRLNKEFKVRRSLPVFRAGTGGLELPPPQVEVRTVTVQAHSEKVKTRPWYFLWLLEVEDVVHRPARNEKHFECSLSALHNQAIAAVEAKFDELSLNIDEYIDERLNRATEEFFQQANQQLKSYRTSLEQVRQDQALTRDEQVRKQKDLARLAADASVLYDQFAPLSRAADNLLQRRRLMARFESRRPAPRQPEQPVTALENKL